MQSKNGAAPSRGEVSAQCSPARLPAAFQASSALMLMVDPETALIIDANLAASEFYGFPQEELRGTPAAQVSLRPSDKVVELMRALKCGGGGRFVSRHRLRGGEVRDMELNASTALLEDGREVLLFVGHDITPLVNAQRALREREGLLKAILDSAGEGIGFKDTEHIYREANPAFCTMLGAPCEQVLGRTSASFFTPEADAQNTSSDLQVMEQKTGMVYETHYPGKDGPRQVRVHKSPVFDADGDCLGVVFISHDITDERRAGEALKKSEGLLRAMLNSARDSIFVVDTDGVFRMVNTAFCELLDKPEEDILGHGMDEVFEATELHMQRSTQTLTATTRQPVHFAQRVQRPGGGPSGPGVSGKAEGGGAARPVSDVWISVVKTPIEDESGELMGILGMGRDITEQRVADAALRESERRFSTLARQLPVGVFEADAAGGLTFANERMLRLTGRTQEQLAGNGWLMSVHAQDRAEFVRAWQQAQSEAGSLSREVRLVGPRGVVAWVACRIAPMRDGGGRVMGYLGSLDDISERKQAEALREDVEAVVRHDLKSPLGGLQSALELLGLLGPLTVEQQQVCTEARELLRRMLGLITLSLDLAAIEAGRYTTRPEAVDVTLVLEALRRELRPLLSAKALTLDVEGAEPGSVIVQGERRLLDNALANLLKNAAEAAPLGGNIEVRLAREPGDAPFVSVAIRNPGEVPRDMRARFFEKYATSGKPGGTGLGTYSALLLVRTMGGSLALDVDEPGHTTITVRLPLPPA